MASAKTSNNPSPEPPQHHNQEELEKLEEMNGMLRLKLNEADAEIEKVRQETARLSESMDKDQHQHDIERAALQLELTDSRKRERELASKFDTLDERFRAMLEAHQEALRVSDELNADLKEERRRCVDMEHEMKKSSSDRQENEELLELIRDLREEKRLLEQEQANLLDAQFNRDREEEYQNEIEELRENLRKHIKELAYHLDEKRAIHEENDALKEHLRELRDEKHDADRHMFEIQQELDELREKMNFFCKDGEIDISEIEEALSIVRLRRERGISLDFLMEAEELYADKELLQELRVQYADCIHELEKVRKLLYLQEHINKDYKLECEELNRKIEALKNGYELRLEEDSRLLDLRANKIAHLEGQLKSIVYGTAKIPGEIEKPKEDDDDMVELATGQNMIEIHIESALISDDGLYYIRKLGLDMEDSAKLTTFIHYDFFEFETQVSPMGLGQKPVFNFTSKYKVYTDDFFLQYLQSKHTVMYFAVSNGTEFFNVATCSMVMKELTDPDRTDRLRYYADLISTHDGRTIIGKIDFGLRVRLPMAQAIRSYKERTVALNLLTVSDKEVSSRRFRPRSDTNDLVIRIINCTHLRQPPGRTPAVFASFQFYIHETMVTDTIRNSTSPMINFLRILPLPMTSDLDRYLRTGALHIMILDDNDGIEDFEYGSVAVPLLPLALGEKIYDEFFLNDGFGNGKSKITVSLEWSKPYKLNVVPLISQLDEQVASTNGRSNKAIHSQDNGDDDDEDTESKSHDAASHTDAESESMDKFKASNLDSKRKQYKRRNLSDDEGSSKPSRTSEVTSTTGDEGESVITSSTADAKKPPPSDVSAMSTIDEHADDKHSRRDDEHPKKSNHDLKRSKEAIAERKSKESLHDRDEKTAKKSSDSLHKKESDTKKSKEGLEEETKRSRENMGSRKASHKSLKEEKEEGKPISRKSSRRNSPHRSLEDVKEHSDSKHDLKKSKEHIASHKSSHKSLKEEKDDSKEDKQASYKSSHKSLKDDKEEKMGSRKSSHKSLKEEKEEKHSSRKSSHKTLKEEQDEEKTHHKSSESVKKIKESIKKSKECLKKSKESVGKLSHSKRNESSETSSSDSESGSKTRDRSDSESDEESSEIKKSNDISAETNKSTSSKASSNDSDSDGSEQSGSITPKAKSSSKQSLKK
ncbi:UNVERIFIED_CONTAM: X-linked retinitis pigmentosa GTPase regulator-interacting protein 1 [Siphonaria sp. JEL0065]|nr:X-linked retinitis pigmentosa GTPase regulator-interacting protein 1 [Siphonaria sp. JEL0065]